MRQSISQSLQELSLRPLGFRSLWFCLSLLALGLTFWTVGQFVTLRILNRSYQTPRYFIANVQSDNTSRNQISTIKVKINGESGISIVEVISDDPNLLEREFQLTLTDPQDIEQAIAQELEIPLQDVRRLIYYRVRSR